MQDLLAAKRDLALPRQLRKLDNYDFLLLDDLDYLPQGAADRGRYRYCGLGMEMAFRHLFGAKQPG